MIYQMLGNEFFQSEFDKKFIFIFKNINPLMIVCNEKLIPIVVETLDFDLINILPKTMLPIILSYLMTRAMTIVISKKLKK